MSPSGVVDALDGAATRAVGPPDDAPAGPRPRQVELGPRRLSMQRPAGVLVVMGATALWIWLLSGAAVAVLAGIALWGAVVLDAVLARRGMRGPTVDVGLQLPRRVTAGHPVLVEVRARAGRGPVRITLPWSDPPGEFAVDQAGPGVVALPGTGRGVASSVVLDLAVRGPLGLVEARRRSRVTLPSPMAVVPAAHPHGIRWPAWRTASVGLEESAPRGHDLFRGVRDYVPGDPRRSVHWKATAHHGSLMVRESDGRGVVVLRLVVALSESSAAAEVALGRAAAVVHEALARRWRVLLVTVEPSELPRPAALDVAGAPVWCPDLGGRPVTRAVPGRTRATWVRSRHQADVQLAATGTGTPRLDRFRGTTLVVTPHGDRWC